MDPHRVWTLACFARSLIGSALRGPLRATLREALRFVGANLPVRCRLRSISLRCYVMARSAVLSADTRRLRAAPLARSLPLPRGRLTASPCRAEGAKGATLPNAVCCAYRHVAETNQMLRHSLPEAARARLRPSVGLLSRNAIVGAVPANPDTRSARRRGHRRVRPNRKIKTESPLRSASMSMVAALQSPGSRRSVAPHRLCAPLPPAYSPALPRDRHRPLGPGYAPPLRPLGIRARPPRWGSLYASGSRLTTASRRQARPSGKRYSSFARSRQASLRSDCRSSGFSTDGSATAKTRGRSAHPLLFGAPGRRQTDATR